MDSPIALPGRFALKGLLKGGGYNHHIDARDTQAEAIDAAESVYGYDRVFVLDTQNRGAVVWDSAEAGPRMGAK